MRESNLFKFAQSSICLWKKYIHPMYGCSYEPYHYLIMNFCCKWVFFSNSFVRVDPWKMSLGTSNTGTGFIISKNRIVTNAHVVHRGQSIFCKAQNGGHLKKFECFIQSIALPLDLAILKVHDENFFRDKKHLTLVDEGFQHLPHLDDNVTVVEFPRGGESS